MSAKRPKKPYSSPRLRAYGDLRTITRRAPDRPRTDAGVDTKPSKRTRDLDAG